MKWTHLNAPDPPPATGIDIDIEIESDAELFTLIEQLKIMADKTRRTGQRHYVSLLGGGICLSLTLTMGTAPSLAVVNGCNLTTGAASHRAGRRP